MIIVTAKIGLLPFPNDNRRNGASLVLKSVKRAPARLNGGLNSRYAWQPQGVLDDQLVDENGEGVSYCKRLWKMKIALP